MVKDDIVDKNFLLISLEGNQAKKIAEVINNDTARKILDHLAKKDCTETELSKNLDIPISTVHYNLKQLQDANLVVVEEFHYSTKGREVNHYRLANKYIIIAPKSDSRIMEALKKIIPIAVITAIVGAAMTSVNFLQGKPAEFAAKDVVQRVATSGAAAPMMAAAPAASNAAIQTSQPFMQSAYVIWFLVGALAVMIIYFAYEIIKK